MATISRDGGLTTRAATAFFSDMGGLAVLVFFAMSAHVLTRAWDGHFVTFLARRIVRLWPVYAVCLVAGGTLLWRMPAWSEFVWYPVASSLSDPPSWSLCVEAWAMLFTPAIVWRAVGSRWRLGLVCSPGSA